MASCLHNGDNESFIGLSQSFSVGFSDYNGNEVEIPTSSKSIIDIWISRDLNFLQNSKIKLMNASSLKNNGTESQLYPISFTKTAMNSSLHIEFSPLNFSIGYLVLLKFNSTPKINSTLQEFDSWKMFCPAGKNKTNFHQSKFNFACFIDADLSYSNILNRKSYLFFMSPSEMGNYRGNIGVGIRELNNDELSLYCSNLKSKPVQPPYSNTVTDLEFTSDFYYHGYSSGCYYIDLVTGKWSSYGLELNADDISYTHCKSNHLTTFAVGLDIFPSSIDFKYVSENSSFEKNKTIYLTVLILFVIYILFSIWGRWMDKQDLLKIGVTPLIDNNPIDDYFYEIIVFTGNRVNAGTDSKVNILEKRNKIFQFKPSTKVRFKLFGDDSISEIRIMEDNKRKPFRRGGVDSFIMANKQYFLFY